MIQHVDLSRAAQATQARESLMGGDKPQGNAFFEVFAQMSQAMIDGEQDGEIVKTQEDLAEEILLVAPFMQMQNNQELNVEEENAPEVFVDALKQMLNQVNGQEAATTQEAVNTVAQVNVTDTNNATKQTTGVFIQATTTATPQNHIKIKYDDVSSHLLSDDDNAFLQFRPQVIDMDRIDKSALSSEEFLQIQKALGDEELNSVNTQVLAENVAEPSFDITQKKAEIIAKQPEFVNQMKFGINETMEKGEFVMKLYPEELGEVTIKLVNDGAKQVLEIVTATAQATKLINDDLAVLREAFRPLQIEVRESITVVEQSHNSQMSDLGAFNERQNRQNLAQQSLDNIYYPLEEEERSEEATVMENALDMLSIYI